ncbi:MAG TPA: VOC family protein [Dehalococcoidia bacterium]|nr:VOC family protein [Dehalococcoidia bacterium]
MQVRRIETVIQWVADVDASAQWYSDFLGVEMTPYDAPYFRFAEHCDLILAPSSDGTGRGGTGVWFEVEDVDAAYAELAERGYSFNEEPWDIPPGRLVTLNDPDGNIIGLIDNSTGGMPGF